MKTYTLKAVLIFTALTFVFPVFILLVALLVGETDSKSMMGPYVISSFFFLTFFYTKFSLSKFKLPESIVFAFIVAGIVVAVLLKVCLVLMRVLGFNLS